MSKVAIVTDSGAYLPSEWVDEYPIRVIPFQLVWGNEVYRDGVDITPEEFYRRLREDSSFPGTSQPPPEVFRKAYEDLLNDGFQILSIHSSSKLSGTYSTAVQASQMLPGTPINVVDSETTAIEMGFHVLEAAKAAEKGATLEECHRIAEETRRRTGIYFIVNTLDYLYRGGRIGGAAVFFGMLLNVKPILHIRNGRVEVVEKMRTISKANEKILDLVEGRIKEAQCVSIAALYANEPERAEALLDSALQRFNGMQIDKAFCATISPVIGAHTGPDGVALAYMIAK
jgi:DegV family protein with EDD domain